MNDQNANQWVVDATAESFQDDVFERSKSVPVVLDFWAEWCGPCRALGPVLYDLAKEYDGRIVVVKANTEELQEQAMEFQVSSIPAVFGIVDGEVVDFFQGALPPEQIREWLGGILSAGELKNAQALESESPAEAEKAYRQLLEQSPENALASIGLARSLISQQADDEAKQILAALEARGFLEPEAQKVKAQLDLSEQSGGDVDAARQALVDDPDNFDKKLELAKLLAGNEAYEESMDLALELVSADRQATGEQARLLMIEVFQVLADDSEMVNTYRRRLSMALY